MDLSRKAKRELSLILLFFLCLPLLYLLAFGEGGYLALRRSRAELKTLQGENLRLRREQQLYLQNIKELKNDPHAIERIARERYDFARPGDIVVQLPPSEQGSQKTAESSQTKAPLKHPANGPGPR